MSNLINVRNETELANLKRSKGYSVVEYMMPQCPACVYCKQAYANLAKKYPNAYFGSVNVLTADIAHARDITATPTFEVFRNGALIKKIVGADVPKVEVALQGK
jgi:thiol-disulfide isomerase/thioredoxin